MSVKKLIEFFAVCKPPITIQNVADQIRESFGVVDRIWYCGFDEHQDVLLGMLLQWETRHVYGEITADAAVCFNANVSLEWQRLICCKELIHLLDPPGLKVNAPPKLTKLLDRLLGGLDYKITSLSHARAAMETMAQYQAVAVLFPHEAREEYVEAHREGTMSLDAIAEDVLIPREYVTLVMDDMWKEVRERLLSF